MRATPFVLLGLVLAIAGSAAAAPLPPLPQPPVLPIPDLLPNVPLPDVPLPPLPGLSAGCLGLTVQLGTAGFSITPPTCHVNEVASPPADPVGAEFPALPALPELPEVPLPL